MIEVGQRLPEVLGIDQDGKEWKTSDFKGKKLVLYIYPKDSTPGCTNEACNLRDNYKELRDKDQDKYKEYLSMVLREILQDPLRHRVDPNSARNTSLGKASLDNVVKLAENVVKLSKEISQVS